MCRDVVILASLGALMLMERIISNTRRGINQVDSPAVD